MTIADIFRSILASLSRTRKEQSAQDSINVIIADQPSVNHMNNPAKYFSNLAEIYHNVGKNGNREPPFSSHVAVRPFSFLSCRSYRRPTEGRNRERRKYDEEAVNFEFYQLIAQYSRSYY